MATIGERGTIELNPGEKTGFVEFSDGKDGATIPNLGTKRPIAPNLEFGARNNARVDFASRSRRDIDSMFSDGIPEESVDHMFAGGNPVAEGDSFITISYRDNDGNSWGYHGPTSGIPGNGKDISISYEKINETIALLKKAITSLDSSNSDIKDNLKRISNEWLGKDANTFMNNVTNLNKKISLAIKALTLLATTYQKAANMVQDKQNATKQVIDNL